MSTELTVVKASQVYVIKGQFGLYLSYFYAGRICVRLQSDPDPTLELWFGQSSPESDWLFNVYLIVGAWEASLTCLHNATSKGRHDAWKVATSGEQSRDRAYIYHESFEQGIWNVRTLQPIAQA
jgi:hypothetical protein